LFDSGQAGASHPSLLNAKHARSPCAAMAYRIFRNSNSRPRQSAGSSKASPLLRVPSLTPGVPAKWGFTFLTSGFRPCRSSWGRTRS